MRPGRRISQLSTRDLAVLTLERQWGQSVDLRSAKLAQAKKDLGLTAQAYTLIVNALIDDPAALAHDPATVQQLRDLRQSRRAVQAEEASA